MATNRKPNTRTATPPSDAAAAEALKTAYEIHTLAQLLYARMAAPAIPMPVAPPVFH
jgi:hypothetical protein